MFHAWSRLLGLEDKPPGQLDLPRTGALRGLQAGDLAEPGVGKIQTARRSVVRMVEQVRDLGADLKIQAFRKADVLDQRNGHSVGPCAHNRSVSGVSVAADRVGWDGEGGRIDPLIQI